MMEQGRQYHEFHAGLFTWTSCRITWSISKRLVSCTSYHSWEVRVASFMRGQVVTGYARLPQWSSPTQPWLNSELCLFEVTQPLQNTMSTSRSLVVLRKLHFHVVVLVEVKSLPSAHTHYAKISVGLCSFIIHLHVCQIDVLDTISSFYVESTRSGGCILWTALSIAIGIILLLLVLGLLVITNVVGFTILCSKWHNQCTYTIMQW